MTRINHSLILVLCVVSLALCGCRQNKNLFTLEGSLTHLEGDEFYLFGTQPPFDRIDTIRLEEGRFAYEMPMDTVNMLTLLLPDGHMLPLFADKGITVTVEGDARQPDSIRLSGGALNEELNVFRQRIGALTDTLQIVAEADSFIRTHPFSQVSIYLLDRYFVQTPQSDYNRIKLLVESMSGMLHDHPLVQSVQERFNDALKAEVGRTVSGFRMKSLNGVNMTSYTFRDKVLLLSFWATWDEPSRAMLEQLKAMYKKLKKEEIAFVYYALDTDLKQWRDSVQADTLSGRHACDGDGWESNAVKQFGVEKIPMTYLLTPQRKVVVKTTDMEVLKAKTDSLLKSEKERKQKLKRK